MSFDVDVSFDAEVALETLKYEMVVGYGIKLSHGDAMVHKVRALLRRARQDATAARDREWSKQHGFPEGEILDVESAGDHIHNCVIAERERCARLARGWTEWTPGDPDSITEGIAAAIRAGEAKPDEE